MQLAPLRRRAKEAETTLAKLAGERATIERALADPALYTPGRAADITAAQTKLAAVTKAIAAAEMAWLEAEEAIEAASA